MKVLLVEGEELMTAPVVLVPLQRQSLLILQQLLGTLQGHPFFLCVSLVDLGEAERGVELAGDGRDWSAVRSGVAYGIEFILEEDEVHDGLLVCINQGVLMRSKFSILRSRSPMACLIRVSSLSRADSCWSCWQATSWDMSYWFSAQSVRMRWYASTRSSVVLESSLRRCSLARRELSSAMTSMERRPYSIDIIQKFDYHHPFQIIQFPFPTATKYPPHHGCPIGGQGVGLRRGGGGGD